MNNNCLKTPPMDNILPSLSYANVKTTMHNKNVFRNTLGETFTFLTCDVHTETCPWSCEWCLWDFQIFYINYFKIFNLDTFS